MECLSAAWPSGSQGRFYDGHARKVDDLTPTQAWLLRPWTRCFTTIILAWWNLTSSKLKKLEAKFKRKTRKHRQLLRESAFILHIAPSSLSRDRRIKMKKKSHQRKSKVQKKHICEITSQIRKNEFWNLQKRRLKTTLNFLSSLFS